MRWLPLIAWLLSLYGGWALLWASHERWMPGLGGAADLGFWTLAKALVWFGPAALWLRAEGKGLLEGFGLERPGPRALIWGALYSALWLVLCEAQAHGGLVRPVATQLTLAHASAVLLAPLLEEALFRGFLRQKMRQLGLGTWPTVGLCAVLFAALHLPGWVATGRFAGLELLRELGVLSLTGLCFGLVRERGGVLGAAVPLHFVNNLWSSGVFGFMLQI